MAAWHGVASGALFQQHIHIPSFIRSFTVDFLADFGQDVKKDSRNDQCAQKELPFCEQQHHQETRVQNVHRIGEIHIEIDQSRVQSSVVSEYARDAFIKSAVVHTVIITDKRTGAMPVLFRVVQINSDQKLINGESRIDA